MKRLFYCLITLLLFSCAISKEYYDSGAIESKGKLSNEEKIGEWKYYHATGEYRGGGDYLNGKRNGSWKWFHENSQLKQIGDYVDDKQTGQWKFFYSNGNRQGVITMSKGNLIGLCKWYFSNGELQTERQRNDDGQLINIISCFDGKGNELNKGTLTNGNGTMNVYDIDGNLIQIAHYQDGVYIDSEFFKTNSN